MSCKKEYQLSVHVREKIQNIHNSNELHPETFVELGIILDYFHEMIVKFVDVC